MTLRTQLLLGLSAFVGALVVLGGWSAWHLRQMSALSERIIAENYDSVVAAQAMKGSLERQDSAAFFALLDRRDRALTQLREHRTRFDAAYERAAANITEPGEADAINAIGRTRDEYYRAFDRFLVDLGNEPSAIKQRPAVDEYFQQLEPIFSQLRRQCDRLLDVNQDAMRRKAHEAATIARGWFLTTLGTAVALVVGGILFSIVLSASILRPVRQLTDATSRVAAGELDTVVDVRSRDELGVLAARFNDMANRIRELRQTDLGRILVAQQTAEAAIASLYDPVIVTDAEGRVQRINRAAEPLFGSASRAVGKRVQDVTTDPRLSMAVLDVLASQRTIASEESAATVPLVVDGAERSFRQRTTPMRDAADRLVGAVMLLEDITHLREIDRVKSEFIAAASHELRTPLTSLEMGVHLLLEPGSGPLSAIQRELLTMCRDDAMRLDRLVKDLLDLSRIESGEAPPTLAAVSTRDLITRVADSLRQQQESKGISLHIDVATDLPSIMADRGQIERVITNLLTNAIRATERGGAIDVAATQRDGYVAISVRDTGRGIPRDHLGRVFEPFVQVPNAPTGGAGLGLSISRRIVQAHGGQITVRSELGHGTTFTFTIPVASTVAG